ncbi:trypsin-like serine protease, partial [Deinococcus sp. HMF7620]
QGNVLDEIIAMGLPNIAHSIEATLITTSGEIVATDYIHSAGREMHVMNAKVKGGNSGGPIINRLGQVVGIVTNDEFSESNQNNVFSLAVPSKEIDKLIANINCISRPVTNLNGWSSFRKSGIKEIQH